MSNIINLVSSYVVVSNLIRNYGLIESEGTLIEWIGEALEEIGMNNDTCTVSTCFSNVLNYSCNIPMGCKVINQIAKHNGYYGPDQIMNLINEKDSSILPIIVDQAGNPVNNFDYVYYRPYFDRFDVIFEYDFSTKSWNNFRKAFTPIKLSNSTFQHYPGLTIRDTYEDEYFVKKDSRQIYFNFESGQVAISYLKFNTDPNFFPMIPDHVVYISAVEAFIIYRKAKRDFYNHVEGAKDILLYSERDWEHKLRNAKNKSFLPDTIDEHENIIVKSLLPMPLKNRFFQL
jgi:hypothetical protein